MPRHIAWFNEAPIEPDPKGGLRSSDERVCRRCLAPASELEDRGVPCSVFGNLPDADETEVCRLLQQLNTEIVIIGAFSDPSLFKLARAAKHLGCYVLADFADQTAISDDFRKLATIADHIVAATPEAAERLVAAGMSAVVISDLDADAWLACFKALKAMPPVCANTNVPPDHG